MRVLLVEDDAACRVGAQLVLKAAEIDVSAVTTGEDALDFLQSYDVDAVVLDLGLPGMDGYQVLSKLRSRRNDVPVLVVTGVADSRGTVKALGLGADGFVTKPVERSEFVARVQAIVRRAGGHSQSILRAGELEMDQDEDNHAVALGGQRLKLTRKQYAILELLLLRKGQVVSKETLMDHLYGGSDEPSFRTIDVFVCLMRKRLAQIGCEGLIKTIRGSGYLLEAQHAPCLAFGAPLPARHLPRDALAA